MVDKLLFIGWINGTTFDGNVGKLLVSFRRGRHDVLRRKANSK